ncbi:hypothetical protein AAG570_006723 [Ranatra chinensis]|uniref:Deoxyribonuclease TATDN1 n=1 Tax=Ranatra chinensis TaxID=642074 RepID=A0ABD0YUX1_9HEMI
MYSGIYNGAKKHEPDLQHVLHRAWENGLAKLIITGGNLDESKKALELVKEDNRLYSTVGCHPTRCKEFEDDPESYFEGLSKIIENGESNIVAVGECGLDYDRLQFCDKETQLKFFEKQLGLSKRWNLPLFLHCRNSADDLISILSKHEGLKGVVHSFDGSKEEMKTIVSLGYYIGLNGCSLKTQDNLDVVKEVPNDKLLLETDCPWCEVRPSHAGSKFIKTTFPSVKKEKWRAELMVKGRNEPANIIQILEIISAVKGENVGVLSEQVYRNTMQLFFPNESLDL